MIVHKSKMNIDLSSLLESGFFSDFTIGVDGGSFKAIRLVELTDSSVARLPPTGASLPVYSFFAFARLFKYPRIASIHAILVHSMC